MQRQQEKVSHVTMYKKPKSRKREDRPAENTRVVCVYIKATDHYGHIRFAEKVLQEKGDRLTEIAAIELVNGKPTGRKFFSFVKPEDPVLIEHCMQRYQTDKALSAAQVEELCSGLITAPTFSKLENKFMEFAFAPGTKVIVDFKMRVLEHLRAQLSKDAAEKLNASHKEVMRDINSDIAEYTKLGGKNNAGRYAKQLDDKGKAVLDTSRQPARGFDAKCEEFGFRTRKQTNYKADYDCHRLMKLWMELQKRMTALKAEKAAAAPAMKAAEAPAKKAATKSAKRAAAAAPNVMAAPAFPIPPANDAMAPAAKKPAASFFPAGSNQGMQAAMPANPAPAMQKQDASKMPAVETTPVTRRRC